MKIANTKNIASKILALITISATACDDQVQENASNHSDNEGESALPATSESDWPLREEAVLEFPDGRTLAFLASADAIVIKEEFALSEGGTAPLLANLALRELSPLEIFLSLTPEEQTVPEALIYAADEHSNMLANRQTTSDPIGHRTVSISDEEFRIRVKVTEYYPILNNEICDSSANFYNDICAPNYSNPYFICHSGLETDYFSHGDGRKFKHSLSAVVGCGAGSYTEIDMYDYGWSQVGSNRTVGSDWMIMVRIDTNRSREFRYEAGVWGSVSSGGGIRAMFTGW